MNRSIDRELALVGAGRRQNRVAECGVCSVVVAVDLERHHAGNLRRGIGSRPHGAQIETFAPEDAKDIGLCGGAVDIALGAPVIFRDARSGARIKGRHPAFHARDQHQDFVGRLLADPALVHVVGVPKLAR